MENSGYFQQRKNMLRVDLGNDFLACVLLGCYHKFLLGPYLAVHNSGHSLLIVTLSDELIPTSPATAGVANVNYSHDIMMYDFKSYLPYTVYVR